MRSWGSCIAAGFVGLVLITGGARADWFRDELPPANAKPLSTIIKTVEDQGNKVITEVSFDDGKWEIEIHQPGGKESTIYVDAVSGQIVRK